MLLALLKGLYAARADFTHFLREKRIGVVENLLLSRNITNGSGNLTCLPRPISKLGYIDERE